MNIQTCSIPGLLIIQPQVFSDPRGHFFESFNKKKTESFFSNIDFVQDNQSLSSKNVLRGLHYQRPPYAQGKLVRVVRGSVLDVAVDIRKNSPTYGKYFSILLSEKNHTIFYIPPGFAHGFLTLEDHTIFLYKCTNFYHKESEETILWNDPDIGINWGLNPNEEPLLSEKDAKGLLLKNINSPFIYE